MKVSPDIAPAFHRFRQRLKMARQIENAEAVVIAAESVFGNMDRQVLQGAESVNQPLRIKFLQIKIFPDRTDLVAFVTSKASSGSKGW